MDSIFEHWWEVISDPGHILAEFTFVLVEMAVLTPIVRLGIKWHDRRAHSNEACVHECVDSNDDVEALSGSR